MVIPSSRRSLIAILLAAAVCAPYALAQQEFPPPQGNGRLVVLVSGTAGPKHDREFAQAIAALGYDVVLFDGNKMEGKGFEGIRSAIERARQMPHAVPGKVALIGLSLGGGIALAYGSLMPNEVAVDIVWYPATGFFSRFPGFARRIRVPVLMFAGESDTYRDCCLISTARAIAAAAAAAKVPFELVTYPKTGHDFIVGGSNYNPQSYQDALDRTAARLKGAFGD
ncbi:MAG: dienelactone hydrolase family protein [Candidatus Aminicenantales bacterium]|jgi:dienelactone hydrolase